MTIIFYLFDIRLLIKFVVINNLFCIFVIGKGTKVTAKFTHNFRDVTGPAFFSPGGIQVETPF